MDIKSLYKRIIFYLTVPKCVSCGERLTIKELALCERCYNEHRARKKARCSVCGKELPECVCTNKYLREHYVKRLIKLFVYKSSLEENKKIPSNELIYHVKRTDRKDLIDFIAADLVSSIKNNIPDYKEFLITNVPRTRKRVLKYGHDHSEKIARAVAKELNIKYVSVLKSVQRRAQKKLENRSERFVNAKFEYKSAKPLSTKKIFILDDIVTTGASMGHAAMLLRGLGAKTIVGVSMAIAYKDKYTPFKRTEF